MKVDLLASWGWSIGDSLLFTVGIGSAGVRRPVLRCIIIPLVDFNNVERSHLPLLHGSGQLRTAYLPPRDPHAYDLIRLSYYILTRFVGSTRVRRGKTRYRSDLGLPYLHEARS